MAGSHFPGVEFKIRRYSSSKRYEKNTMRKLVYGKIYKISPPGFLCLIMLCKMSGLY